MSVGHPRAMGNVRGSLWGVLGRPKGNARLSLARFPGETTVGAEWGMKIAFRHGDHSGKGRAPARVAQNRKGVNNQRAEFQTQESIQKGEDCLWKEPRWPQCFVLVVSPPKPAPAGTQRALFVWLTKRRLNWPFSKPRPVRQ